MKDLDAILARCARAQTDGEPAVLATIVAVAGSTYRRPGARMLLTESGPPIGLISGGCLEDDLAEKAREVLGAGRPRTVVYDMRSPDDIVWGLGLGCNGEVRVLLEPLGGEAVPEHLEFLDRCDRRRETAVVATIFEIDGEPGVQLGERLLLRSDEVGGSLAEAGPVPAGLLDSARDLLAGGVSRVESYPFGSGAVRALLERVEPRVALLVFGAGTDAQPVTRLAAELGWRVEVLDNRAAYATPERFPQADRVAEIDLSDLAKAGVTMDRRTAVLVMTHHFLRDVTLLTQLLSSRSPYIGLLGPRKRFENLIADLRRKQIEPTAEQRQRLYGPVGIDVGSETPAEIALSAVAEIQAVMTSSGAGFLRDRRGPLHGAPP